MISYILDKQIISSRFAKFRTTYYALHKKISPRFVLFLPKLKTRLKRLSVYKREEKRFKEMLKIFLPTEAKKLTEAKKPVEAAKPTHTTCLILNHLNLF